MPDTVLHKRPQAGYALCVSLKGRCSGERVFGEDMEGFELPPPRSPAEPAPAGEIEGRAARVRLSPRQGGGNELFLELSREGTWEKIELPGLALAPGVQVQSFDARAVRDRILLVAWSESSPVMGGQKMSEGQVLALVLDLDHPVPDLIEVSMSETDSRDVVIIDDGNSFDLVWRECTEDECGWYRTTPGLINRLIDK